MESLQRLARRPRMAGLLSVGVLLLLALSLTGCGNGSRDETGGAGGAGKQAGLSLDPNRENPDRESHRDLFQEPFHPEWVGGTLVISRSGVVSNLNHVTMRDTGDGSSIMRYFLCPRLLRVSPDRVDGAFRVEPWAAASLPQMAADGLSCTWKLRDDITWEDGRPVTAADYVFTWQRIRDPEVKAARRRADLERVKDVSATGEHALRVTFKEPYYRAAADFGLKFTVTPAHAMPADAATFNETGRQLSCGAYRIATFDQDRLTLRLRDEYRERRPPVHPAYVENVEYRRVVDRASILAQVKAGQVDLSTVTQDQFEGLDAEAGFKERCWKTAYALPGYTFVGWNLWARGEAEMATPHPVLGDVRVRRALAMLFPRRRMIADLCHGRALPSGGIWFHEDADQDPDVRPFGFDPQAARALLAEAGWKPGADGYQEKDGRRLSISLHYPTSSGVFDGPVTLFQEAARRVGVTVELVPVADFRTLFPVLRSRGFDAFCVRWGLDPLEPDLYSQWHSRNAAGGSNFCGLKDAEVDRLIEGYRRELDPAARRSLRRRLHRRIHELQPYAFLFSRATPLVVARRWANVWIHDLGPRFYDFVLRERLRKGG